MLGRAYIFLFIGLMSMILPMARFDTAIEGIEADEVDWTCDMPIKSLNAFSDLDQVRIDIAAATDAEALAATEVASTATDADPDADSETIERPTGIHPDCKSLARVQFVIGIISLAAAAYTGRKSWIETADARAEKKFKRLHTPVKSRKSFGS
jgi:hypothetical protein